MRIILSGILIIIGIYSSAQQRFFAGAEIGYGYMFRKIESKDVLKANGFGSSINVGLNASYRIFNAIQIEGGFRTNRQSLPLRDKHFEDRIKGFEATMKSTSWYRSYYGSIKYSHEVDHNIYAYCKIGYEFNSIRAESLSQSAEYVKGFETLSINTSFTESNTSITPEIGLETFTHRGHQFVYGLKYNHAFGNPLMTGEYKVTNGPTTIAEDQFKMSGKNISFTVQFNYVLWQKAKREKTTKPIKDTEIADVPMGDTAQSIIVSSGEANGREYDVNHKIRVSSPKVTVTVYDHQIEDGDIISLILNDHWIIQNYHLTKTKKVFEIELKEGNNDLILYALNLGKYAPNTAAIIVDDGSKKHEVILESTLDKSDALEIKYVHHKK